MKIKSATAILTAIILFLAIFLVRCAKPGTPAGGPKDTDPPEFVEAEPPNRTVFFDQAKITITFNEFVQLKDASKEVFVSPPMKNKPDVKAQGKKVIVEFNEELYENSTYTISFGNAIVDYTESNPLVNFEYVFSTGAYIDSLSIPGKVLNAFDHKPVESILVMVYQDNNDTIPLDSLPLRVTPKNASKTTKDGTFRINNLAPGEYMIFALEDYNNNFIFDLPNERIAFLDSLITISPPPGIISPPPDPVPADSVEIYSPDTVAMEIDSISTTGMQLVQEELYTLYLFQEVDTIQKLLEKKLIGISQLQYVFRLPADSVSIMPVDFLPEIPDWYIVEYSKLKDTLNLWLKPGLPDTIKIGITAADSIADTTKYILSKASNEKPGKRKVDAKSAFSVTSNLYAGALDAITNLQLRFGVPIIAYDTSLLLLFSATDTVVPGFVFTDSLHKQGDILYPWAERESYQLIIIDSAFQDMSGNYNDSIRVRLKVRSVEDYGLFLLNVLLPDTTSGQYIIQLMDEKEKIFRQQIINTSGIIRFEQLMPTDYKLKAIFDANANGMWDTGTYGANTLPEQVEYYPPVVTIRANWDLQDDWQLKIK